MKKSFTGVEAIRPGFPFEVRLTYPADFFTAEELATGRVVAHVRPAVPAALAFVLDSADGSIQRETNRLVLRISAEDSAKLTGGIAVWDFVRISEEEVQRAVPGRWVWPVQRTVTRDIDSETPGSGASVTGGASVTATFEMPSYSGGVEFAAAVVPGPGGKSLHVLAAAPDGTIGRDGDSAVNYLTGDLYLRTGAGWGSPVANFFGGALAAAQAAGDASEATALDRQAVEQAKLAIDALGPHVVTVSNGMASVGAVATDMAQVIAVAAALAAIANVSGNMSAVLDASGALTGINTTLLQIAADYADLSEKFAQLHAFE